MRFGIHPPNAGRHATANGIVEVARAAEEIGSGSVWLFDHLFTPTQIETTYPFAADGNYPLAPTDPLVRSGCADGRPGRLDYVDAGFHPSPPR
ncbi:MAG TPA: hypothetical protein VGG38_04540 [Acidimicrobiales bacterium]|jgi:alkanesulfonate monooxygenase SsuD/methylene tetrahydromethanopterin reductase-like flavin-dependent oxidoreductase (luciferase family)